MKSTKCRAQQGKGLVRGKLIADALEEVEIGELLGRLLTLLDLLVVYHVPRTLLQTKTMSLYVTTISVWRRERGQGTLQRCAT